MGPKKIDEKQKQNIMLTKGVFFLYIYYIFHVPFSFFKAAATLPIGREDDERKKREKKSETFHRAGVKVRRSSVQMMAEPEADPDTELDPEPENQTRAAYPVSA